MLYECQVPPAVLLFVGSVRQQVATIYKQQVIYTAAKYIYLLTTKFE